jgi:hypothetical protein
MIAVGRQRSVRFLCGLAPLREEKKIRRGGPAILRGRQIGFLWTLLGGKLSSEFYDF